MPFLHWFKSKPGNPEAKTGPALVQKPTSEQAAKPETARADLGQENGPGKPPSESRSAQVPLNDNVEGAPSGESVRLQEAEAPVPSAASVSEAGVGIDGENQITLPLRSILAVFPPELESPSIQSLSETEAEIALPLNLVESQLANGRVVVPAEIFSRALPINLKTYFETIDAAAEIPIPLQEIFARLPTESIKLRKDQEIDLSEETIPTPFSAHAEEDAKRFSQPEAISSADNLPEPKDQSPTIAAGGDSQRLQSIFMTDEPLDLAKTIQKVAELPGLRSCVLSTSDGVKLAGNLKDASQEGAIAAFLPGLFQQARLKLEALQAGPLETITLCYGLNQSSIFVQGNLCLTVFHDHRPFKPGVREKVQAVMVALTALSSSENPL